jgi:hypothetical protein
MRGKGGRGASKFDMGDRVRLKGDGPDGPEGLVVAYSYAKETFDLIARNPRAPEQFRNGIEPEELELIPPETGEDA